MADLLLNILYTFGFAVFTGLAQYLQNSSQETFGLKTFLKTLVIGILVGFVMFNLGLNYQGALGVVLQPLILKYVDDLVNAIMDWLGKGPAIIEGAAGPK
jgi:hypothetical protein